GMNFAKITVLQLDDKDRLKMYESGQLSGLALIAPFLSLETYRKYLSGIPQYQTTGIPVLDREDKSTGSANFNSLAYIDISRGYLSDAFYVVLRRPGAYLGGVLRAAVLYFQPASSQAFFKSNRRAAAAADRFCNLVLYGQPAAICGSREVPGFKERIELRRSVPGMGLFLAAAFLLSVCCGFRRVLNLRGSGTADPAAALTVAFLLFNILYVTLVGNLLELGENSRFRFMVDPCILVILALFLRRFTAWAEKPA
ncbi:MAG: hypothetical protein JXQ83_13830, partial [Candidatus Glassbacteria bacterium]|nr:hypothetical protein [Candidatus Glassbacteria bacterium]